MILLTTIIRFKYLENIAKMEMDIFHVDMSGRIYEKRNIGIALVGMETKLHCGCALNGNLIKLVKKSCSRTIFLRILRSFMLFAYFCLLRI